MWQSYTVRSMPTRPGIAAPFTLAQYLSAEDTKRFLAMLRRVLSEKTEWQDLKQDDARTQVPLEPVNGDSLAAAVDSTTVAAVPVSPQDIAVVPEAVSEISESDTALPLSLTQQSLRSSSKRSKKRSRNSTMTVAKASRVRQLSQTD
jgi:hypothetical protein